MVAQVHQIQLSWADYHLVYRLVYWLVIFSGKIFCLNPSP
jgi:hypothetical protein